MIYVWLDEITRIFLSKTEILSEIKKTNAITEELGCDEIQSYFYSNPLTAEQFTGVL